MISVRNATIEKIDNLIETVRSICASPFIGDDVKNALSEINNVFAEHRTELLALANDASKDVVANHCDIVLGAVFTYLPYVGMLHRARHSSNPFEMHGPLKRLAAQVIDQDVRLIISNEWDFSPQTHPSMGDLSDYVLLGLPASESDTALLIPMAGHEFGHPIWERNALESEIFDEAENSVMAQLRAHWDETKNELKLNDEAELQTDIEALRLRADTVRLVRSRCTEVFCDLLGLYIFGSSYCYAFAYLLAPGLVAFQSDDYPTDRERAQIMAGAAATFGVEVPDQFVEAFTDRAPVDFDEIVIAGAVRDLVPTIIALVQRHTAEKGVRPPDPGVIDAVRADLEQAIPVVSRCTVAEILCAAWLLKSSPDLWISKPFLKGMQDRLLADLVLKSVQIQDYWFLTTQSDAQRTRSA